VGAVMLFLQLGQGPVTPARLAGTVSRVLQWGQLKERVSGAGIEGEVFQIADANGTDRGGKVNFEIGPPE
jgi:hypothetical protein